jgi:PAS domain S-box-containing protein
MYYSEKRAKLVDFSTPHIMVTNAIFVRKNSPIQSLEDLQGKEILVQKGDIMHDYVLEENLSSQIIPVENPILALRELEAGDHDAALLARLQGLQIIRSEGLSELRHIPIDVRPRKYCIALAKGEEELLGKINDGLRILKEKSTYDAIYNRWFGLYTETPVIFRDVLRHILWILTPLLLLIGSIILWNRSLRRRVRLQTEQLRQELASRQDAEASLRALLNTLPDFVCFRDGEGRWMETNEYTLRLFGLEKVDYRGKTGSELVAYSPPYFHTFFACSKTDEETWIEGTRHREDQVINLPGGTTLFFDVIKTPIFSEEGKRKYLVVVGRDITERKEMENALREKEEHYRALVEHVPGVVFLCDVNRPWRMFYISEEVLSLTGYPQENFLGDLTWGDLVHPEDLLRVEETINQGILQKKKYQMEYRIHSRDGSIRHIFEKARGIYTEEGTPLYIEGVILDITHRKLKEERVRQLNRDLEERVRERTMQLEHTNRELEAFVQALSQNLRPPLRRIKGFSQALEEDHAHLLDDPGRKALSKIRQGALDLDARMQDLLHFFRINRKSLEIQKLDISAMAAHIVEDLRRETPDRLADISIAPGMIAWGDPELLRRALENLLHNAWKFTSRRERAILTLGYAKQGNQKVYFLGDNGEGFDMAQEERLFDIFRRLHGEEFPGNGMGLAITERIIQRHGGRIWAEGAPGKGATFFFTLPEREGASSKG